VNIVDANTSSIFKIQLDSEKQGHVSFDCGGDELILQAAKRQGVFMANYCNQGACGACTSRLVSGSVSYVRNIKGASQEPKPSDEVRPCSLKPKSDVTLEPLAAWRLVGE